MGEILRDQYPQSPGENPEADFRSGIDEFPVNLDMLSGLPFNGATAEGKDFDSLHPVDFSGK